MKPDGNEKGKLYFVCKDCEEPYEQEPHQCEICGGKEFKPKVMKGI